LLAGLGGGIVKMPEGCNPNEQQMGRGFTNYYCVAKLEEVCRMPDAFLDVDY
jgi:hypothetical protein